MLKDGANNSLVFVGFLASSFDKLTSPSAWANTYIQKFKNNKSLTDAIWTDIEDDIKQQSNKLQKEFKQRKADMQSEKRDLQKQLDDCDEVSDAFRTAIKQFDSDTDDLKE